MQKTSYPKEKIKILLLENISEKAVAHFRNNGYTSVSCISAALNEEELTEAVKDVHILGIRSKTQITEKVLKAAVKLQAIGCFCIGVNQVNLEAATHYGIAVFNAPYSNTRSVAELVMGMTIMLMRRIVDKNTAAHQGIWLKESKGSYELRQKTIGIIGYGNIGTQVGILAESFGMKVRYYDSQTRLPLGNAIACPTLQDLLQQSDVVTLHVPETPQTFLMMGSEMLHQCKTGALLINYSRGSVVDLEALAIHLKQGHIRGAAIDVFPEEPEKNGAAFYCPVQGLPNVVLTPHIGGSTEEAQDHIAEEVSLKLLGYLELGISLGSNTIPPITLPAIQGTHRILHIHNNIPGILSAVNTQLAEKGINIIGQYLKTNDQVGYVVLDVNKQLSGQALDLLRQIPGTVKARILY